MSLYRKEFSADRIFRQIWELNKCHFLNATFHASAWEEGLESPIINKEQHGFELRLSTSASLEKPFTMAIFRRS